jgi:hypothetical protein
VPGEARPALVSVQAGLDAWLAARHRSRRRSLFELYRAGLDVDTSRLDAVLAARTDGVTASILKELLRRAAVFAAENADNDEHVDSGQARGNPWRPETADRGIRRYRLGLGDKIDFGPRCPSTVAFGAGSPAAMEPRAHSRGRPSLAGYP